MSDTAADRARLEEIVAEHRRLLAENPDSLYPAYADALVGLAAQLGEEGLKDKALAAAQEGADHFRALFEVEPATFAIHLASALNNLSNRLSEVDRDEDGRQAGDEAVRLATEVVGATNTDQARFVLISSLMNQAGRSWRNDDPVRAIEEIGTAVGTFRDGGEALNEFLSVMVDALHRNAMALSEAGRWAEAIHIRRLTAGLFRGQPPAPVGHLLALTLEQAAFAVSRAGQPGESLPLVEEAVIIARDIAAADPESYKLFLAQTLANLGGRQHEAGAGPQALESVVEAINLFQQVTEANAGDAVVPLLATLDTFAAILTSLGQDEQASAVLAQRDELIEVMRQIEGVEG